MRQVEQPAQSLARRASRRISGSRDRILEDALDPQARERRAFAK